MENGNEGGAPASGSPPTSSPPAAPAQTPARPEFLPEKFWDPAANAPRVEDLAKSYGELERRLGLKADVLRQEIETELRSAAELERTKNRPADPAAYELKVSDGILPEGIDLNWRNDDPLVSWWRERAHALGLSQDEFREGLDAFAKSTAADLAAADANAAAEIGKLGERGLARVQAVDTWLLGRLGQAHRDALDPLLKNAASVEALEALMQATTGSRMDSGNERSAPAGVTEEALRAKMRDPRYWRDRDPVLVREVTEGFKRLYPEEDAA